jgi:mRNA degradation ribonuclease J1/J2
MTVFEYDHRMLVVDCGVLFPEDDAPGVDLILPDFRPIEDRLDAIEAIVLTHGHEDHIGAVPFLLKLRPDLPVVGSKFTLALLAAKCREHRQTPVLMEVREGQLTEHGPFSCEFLAVNHSIPDALAVAVRTPAGLVLHTGDVKLDQLPLDGRLTDLAGFARLGAEGVDLLLVDLDTALSLPDDKVVLISTGSQGEPLSALSRMARGEHKQVQIRAGDTVVLASSMIPGNETAVFSVVNGLARLGAQVVHQGTATVHVSGHASAGELLYIYNAVRPSNVMPVHGEWRHLRANSALAVATGVPPQRVVLAEDGVVVDLLDGVAAVSGRVNVGHVYVDGLSVGDVGESTLSDRLILGEGGFIAITVAVDSTGRAVAPPTISGRGFSDDPKALDQVVPLVEMELARTEAEGITDTHRIAQVVRRAVGRWVAETYRRRPMIVPTVIPV